MIKLKYDSWDKITVDVFYELQHRIDDAERDENNDITLLNKQIAIISVLADVDEDIVGDLNTNEFGELVKQCDFLTNMPKVKITDKYTIGKNEYRVFLDITNMTMNQYIDFQKLYVDRDKNFKQLLACFLLPKGKKTYCEGYDVKEVVDDIGNMKITDANSIMFFFVLAYQSLTKTMLNYSIKMLRKAMKKEKNKEEQMKIQEAIKKIQEAVNLAENGVGNI